MYVNKQSTNTLQTLISNQINISTKNLNKQIIWLWRENILKNFSKDIKKKTIWDSQTQDIQILLV